MKNYYFTLTRIYETLIEVNAETPEQAVEKYKQLGDKVYDIELEQTNVIHEDLTISEGTTIRFELCDINSDGKLEILS